MTIGTTIVAEMAPSIHAPINHPRVVVGLAGLAVGGTFLFRSMPETCEPRTTRPGTHDGTAPFGGNVTAKIAVIQTRKFGGLRDFRPQVTNGRKIYRKNCGNPNPQIWGTS